MIRGGSARPSAIHMDRVQIGLSQQAHPGLSIERPCGETTPRFAVPSPLRLLTLSGTSAILELTVGFAYGRSPMKPRVATESMRLPTVASTTASRLSPAESFVGMLSLRATSSRALPLTDSRTIAASCRLSIALRRASSCAVISDGVLVRSAE